MSIPHKTCILLICSAALLACSKPDPSVTTGMTPAASAAQSSLLEDPPVVPVVAAPVAAEHAAGKRIFDQTCGLCHGAGVGGAPRPGDKANWAPRIAQGMDTLYRHALEGFSGATSYMPARGGTAVTDSDVKAGVDYMVSLSR
jgi:cytochrome c5